MITCGGKKTFFLCETILSLQKNNYLFHEWVFQESLTFFCICETELKKEFTHMKRKILLQLNFPRFDWCKDKLNFFLFISISDIVFRTIFTNKVYTQKKSLWNFLFPHFNFFYYFDRNYSFFHKWNWVKKKNLHKKNNISPEIKKLTCFHTWK